MHRGNQAEKFSYPGYGLLNPPYTEKSCYLLFNHQ